MFRADIKQKLELVLKHDRLKETATKVLSMLDEMIKIGQTQSNLLEYGARDFAFSLSNIFLASVFLQNATLPNTYSNAELLALRYIKKLYQFFCLLIFYYLNRFCHTQDLVPFLTNYKLGEYSPSKVQVNQNLVMENYRF